jgi:acetyl esterase/lipase
MNSAILLTYGDDPNQFGELTLPATPPPHRVLLVIHGGFWRAAYGLDNIRPFCAAMNDAGLATWNIEYRRLGQPGGGFPGTTEDVRHAARHLKTIAAQYALDLTQVVVAGHSAGGHLALWLAAQQELDLLAAVSLGGVADLNYACDLGLSNCVVRDFLGGTPKEVPENYRSASPIERLPMSTPQLLIHGDADEIVPIEIAESYARASNNGKLLRLPGAGHTEVRDPNAKEWPVVRDAILELFSRNC